MKYCWILLGIILFLLPASCLKHPGLYKEGGGKEEKTPLYLYPFNKENTNIVTEITIQTGQEIAENNIKVSIPPLKYNKSLLFLLTQDDCKHAAYSCTWAAIQGRPLSKGYYYDVRHYLAGDLPPDAYFLKKTLGGTDGTGNEVRFAITTTLAPEWDYMNAEVSVRPGYKDNYYRFYMKSGLIWDNVVDMLNYGTGIAFHDMNTQAVNNLDSIVTHYKMAQDSVLTHLSGRGCKMLAEPNGNKTYVNAAREYAPIQVMTAQAQTIKLYPFKVKDDLQGTLLHRSFLEIDAIKNFINTQLLKKKEDREAINIGVHGTGYDWADFLLWLNDLYGQDGEDLLWFPSLEEYYEYNYYRIHANIEKRVEGKTIHLKISLPVQEYFYYPSLTINLNGVSKSAVESLTTDEYVTGLSYGDFEEGMMINLDCRKYLLQHATHFVEQYEKDRTEINRRDAQYFVHLLKDSSSKNALLERIKAATK